MKIYKSLILYSSSSPVHSRNEVLNSLSLETRLAYCAGIIDSLASFEIEFRKSKSSPFGRKLNIAVIITVLDENLEVLNILKRILKLGSIKKYGNSSHSYTIRGFRSIKKTLSPVVPLLVFKDSCVKNILSLINLAEKVETQQQFDDLVKFAEEVKQIPFSPHSSDNE